MHTKSFTLLAAAVACASVCAWVPTAQAHATHSAMRVSESDQQRRDRLNARLGDMLRSGEGARLTQVQTQPQPPPRRSQPRRRASTSTTTPVLTPTASHLPAATPVPVVTSVSVSGPSLSSSWTIQPPAYVGGSAPRSSGSYYTAPRLDLVTAPRVPTSDVECLTQAIYYEARNESEEGQAAVAEVVINRSRSGAYPASVCAVVYQRNTRTCQFTFTCDGAIGRSPVDLVKWARAERIARDVNGGRTQASLPRTSLNYHANYVSPSWGRRLVRVRQIGNHIFYGVPLGSGMNPGAVATPEPATTTGLIFVRNEALERAYTSLSGAAGSMSSGQP